MDDADIGNATTTNTEERTQRSSAKPGSAGSAGSPVHVPAGVTPPCHPHLLAAPAADTQGEAERAERAPTTARLYTNQRRGEKARL